MQDNMNNHSPFYAGRPIAGRVVSTRPSGARGIRGWYERQNIAIQVSIAIVAIFIPLLTFLLAITSLTSHTQAAPQSFNTLDSLASPVAPTSVPAVMPTPGGAPTPTQVPVTPTPLPNTVANPWGYDFATPGVLITAPPANFCVYFTCIANFRTGQGYVMECQDGQFSLSGGLAGSCADHKDDLRPLYFHPAPAPAPAPAPMVQPTPMPKPQPTATPKPQPTATPKPQPTPTPKPQPTPTPIPPTPTQVVQPNPGLNNGTNGNNNGNNGGSPIQGQDIKLKF